MKVFLIGGGVMGAGIAQLLISSSVVSQVVWKLRTIEKAKKAVDSVESVLDKLISKGRLEESDKQVYLDKIIPVDSYQLIHASDFILEAVTENMQSKIEVFREISPLISENSILASNTSSLSISELSMLAPVPQNVVGMHFFNPATIMRLVEIVSGICTSDETVQKASSFVKALNKTPVLVEDSPGFIVNRMLIPMINEGISIFAEGVAEAADIDTAMKLGANHPIGPLALADLIGNDVCLSIMETLHSETGDPKYRAHPLLRKMVRGRLLGRKTKKGFFEY